MKCIVIVMTLMMVNNDILILIALKLEFYTLRNFALCSQKLRTLIWDNALFWKRKQEMDFFLVKKDCSNKEAYKFLRITFREPQRGLEFASGKGWLEFVTYYLKQYPSLDYKQALIVSLRKKRKNVSLQSRKDKSRS